MLAPGDERRLPVMLEAGRYRVRVSNLSSQKFLRVAENGQDALTIEASEHGFTNDEAEISTRATLNFINSTNETRLFILERMAWSDQAATAAEVTSLQMFRDLFANEALRPGEQISVGTMTILFTDLKGSTRLYREIGDAPAFGRVMSHFDVLRACIAEEDGSLVKTIGDAVMAAFRRPSAALRAILKAQEMLVAPPDGMLPLQLKVGIHAGHCIAVTLNDRLDYFGGTVNMAARLEGLSNGDDVVVSASVYADPEVSAWIDDSTHGLTAERFYMKLKGFNEEEFELRRIKRR
jgi:class 3 adenylate cyclase